MDRHNKRIAGRFLRYGVFACMLLFASTAARAASVSFYLDQSNKLPDGTNYLSVMLTENLSGGVDFLVQTLSPLNGIAGRNFGIQKFGFNFTSNTPYEITGLPDYWRVKKDKQMSEFGRYDIRLQGKGKARTDELSFTVTGVGLGDFDSFFAAHVAGFEWCPPKEKGHRWCSGKDCVSSAYFGGSVSQVPVPAAVWLFASGLLGLIGVARRKARRRVQ